MLSYLTQTSFDGAVSVGTTIVEFTAPWCEFCQHQKPILEAFAFERADVQAYLLDAEAHESVTQRFGVSVLPTLLVFVDGKPLAQSDGLQSPAQLAQLVELAREAAAWDEGPPRVPPPVAQPPPVAPPGPPPTVPPLPPPAVTTPTKAGVGAGAVALVVLAALLFSRRRR